MREIRYIWAINEAIKEEMERDDNVVLIGEDVGTPGGAFGASRGLHDRFGPERVLDTPVSEGGMISATVAEEIMVELDAPITRVGAPFVPIPFSLEKAYLPNANDVIKAVKKTLERTS